jgi:hypothetical protein
MLYYKRFEKDKNEGVFNGVVKDSLIVANYTFASEGVHSVRETAFLINGDLLFEGYGEIMEQGASTKFVNLNKLNFLKNPFIKTSCPGK